MKFSLRALLIVCPVLGLLVGWTLHEFSYETALGRSAADLYFADDVRFDTDANISISLSGDKPESFGDVAAACFSGDSRINSRTIDALLAMPNLKVVSFDRSTIDRDAFKRLHTSTSIELIGFGGTNIADEGLLSLVPLKSLRVVDVFQSDVTPQGVAQFRAARPDVHVQNWYN
ncbi:hypothetical protein [Rhodopirellula halodulae]|uniref:hypothetical protein n=1 Tax=Rhodopirellula halodulae TaxID=2894198 RepID=UPI001E45EC4A|nr:hypothetical protein [Rhodopirellula sp. JC737]MCC9658822.1 hypothetical protein [Rhodopirellula sp. JC737]